MITITNKQYETFEKWARWYALDLSKDHNDYTHPHTRTTLRAWVAAQRTKPLEFKIDHDDDLVAWTPFGGFVIMVRKGSYIYNGEPYNTEVEAVEVANNDFQHKVLSCLLWEGI